MGWPRLPFDKLNAAKINPTQKVGVQSKGHLGLKILKGNVESDARLMNVSSSVSAS